MKITNAAYDWNAYYKGNVVQRWWKHKIAEYTIEMSGGNPVLDVGCGTSPLLSLIDTNHKYGVDVNEEKIEFIRNKDKSSSYTVYNGEDLPFKDGEFHTVICNEVIEHHPKPNELVKELSRVTYPSGIVIISTPDYGSIKWQLVELMYGLVMKSGYELEHKSKFTKTGIESLANAYGLEMVSYKKVAGCDMVCKFRKV
jgi:2-polyprenyl-3-methyl-5-hydroxy-6-metoxy-1,4-benzoquinol methylase